MKSANRTLVLPGGNGFIGRAVAKYMSQRGWDVIVLSRNATAIVEGARTVPWDGETLGPWCDAIDGADVVLNLAGRSVNCRYHAGNREQIERSRVASTRILGEAIAHAAHPPRVWLNSSTATIYRHAEDRPQDDATGEIGSGFSVNVALAWEKAFFDASTPACVRKVALRSAMVMGPGHGGPFSVFQTLVKLRLGGRMGTGRQYVSWIHVDDFCRAIEFLIDRNDLHGRINLAAPQPLRNADFMRELRAANGITLGLPASKWMLAIGAFFLRTETELPLKSRYVVSKHLSDAGFGFNYSNWSAAARALTAGQALGIGSGFVGIGKALFDWRAI